MRGGKNKRKEEKKGERRSEKNDKVKEWKEEKQILIKKIRNITHPWEENCD